MYLQYLVIKSNGISANVFFDGGSQTILVRDQFADRARWSYSRAGYSLAAIGSFAKSIKGKTWNISLKDSSGKVYVTKGY